MPCFVFGRPWVSIEFTLEPSFKVGTPDGVGWDL